MKPEQITAWALNEASAEDRQQLEAALLENPHDKQKAEETKAFCDFLLAELRDDSLSLTDKQRERLVAKASRPPAASAMPVPWHAPRPVRWNLGAFARLAVAACAVLGGFWTWQTFSSKKAAESRLAIAPVPAAPADPAVKVQLPQKENAKTKTGAGELIVQADKQVKSPVGKPQTASKLPPPVPVAAAAPALPTLALKEEQRTMTPRDVSKLKQIQDQNAYALNFGDKKIDSQARALEMKADADLSLSPQITEFNGFINMGNPEVSVPGGSSQGAVTLGGTVSATGSLTQQGKGTGPLTGANTYTGATTVNAGTLALKTGSSSVPASNAALDLNGSVPSVAAAPMRAVPVAAAPATGDLRGSAPGLLDIAGGPIKNDPFKVRSSHFATTHDFQPPSVSFGYTFIHNMGALANGGGLESFGAPVGGGYGMNDIQQLTLGVSTNLGPLNLSSSANYDLFNGGWYGDVPSQANIAVTKGIPTTPVPAGSQQSLQFAGASGGMAVASGGVVLTNSNVTTRTTATPAQPQMGNITMGAGALPMDAATRLRPQSQSVTVPGDVASAGAPMVQNPQQALTISGAIVVGLEPGKTVTSLPASPPVSLVVGTDGDTRYFANVSGEVSSAEFSKNMPKKQEAAEVRRPDPSGESYTRIIENEMKDVQREPLSTLSIDVDTASYANVRRFLNQNMIPPPDAVRIEELVNYFPTSEEGPAHDAKEPFAVRVELAPCPWQPVHRLARIAIKGREMDKNRKPSNLVFLVDVSGSMNEPAKLPLVQQSLRMLTEQLGEGDRVTMVVYAGNSGVVLPPTNGQKRSEILAAIDRLAAGGSTHGSAGIKLAYEQAVAGFIKGGVNRVILCTDGDFNVGVSSPDELEKLIKHKAKTGVFLSVLGFGTGNLKDRTMETLADKGNGNYAYIDSLSEARKVLVEQMGSTLETIAKDVKIQVEFNPAAVRSYRLIGYENRLLAKEDFNDDTKDAGEIGAGHSVVALYELVPANLPAGAEGRPAVDPLKYQTQTSVFSPAQLAEAAKSGETMTVKLRYKAPDSDLSKLIELPTKDAGKTLTASTEEYKFSAAVAGFGLLLRDSAYKGTLSWETVRRLALDGKGSDKLGYRGEFLQLIDKARGLKETR